MDKERLIANYFLDALTDVEKIQFENFLKTNPDFKEEFDFQKAVKQAIIKKEHDNLKHRLQHFEVELKSKKIKKIWWSVAASIILMISIGFYFFGHEISHEALFAEYYKPAKNIIHPIVRNSGIQDDVTMAFIAYQRQDYKSAQKLFQAAFSATQRSELIFYEGITLIELDQPHLAIQMFEKHKNYNDALSKKTNWYLAMAHLKNGDVLEVKALLNEISNNTKAFNNKEAKALLKKL
jgi:hypothetical protein